MPDFLTWMIPYAVLSLLLGGLAVLLCDILRKYIRSRACLMLLVLLCIRIMIPTGWSPIALMHIPTTETVHQEGTTFVPGDSSAVRPDFPHVPDQPIQPPVGGGDVSIRDEDTAVFPLLPETDGQKAQVQWDAWELANRIVPIIWIAGALGCVSVFYIPGVIYRRRLRKSCVFVTDKRLLKIYDDVCADTGVRRVPDLYQSNAVHSPCLCGIFHPYIVLPCSGAFSPQEIEMLLYHEVRHEQSRDLYVKHLINLCLAIQWWNPMLYLLAQRASYYIEASCDERVLQGRDAEFRLQYGALLAKIAKKNKAEVKMYYALEAGFAKRTDHTALRRVRNLLENPGRRHGRATIGCILSLCVLSLFLYGFATPASHTGDASIGEDRETATDVVTTEQPSDENGGQPIEPPEDTTDANDSVPSPEEDSLLIFRRISPYNWYEVVGVRDKAVLEVEIPSTYLGSAVIRVADQAFADCRALTRVVVGSSVKDIGNGVFLRCTSLKEVVLSQNLVSLGASAFRECISLETIVIPDGVMSLRSDTFAYCSALQSVTLGEGMERIETHAFVGNGALIQLTLPASLWMLETSAIKDCEYLSVIRYCGSVRRWKGLVRQTAQIDGELVPWCDGVGFSSVECSDGICEELY